MGKGGQGKIIHLNTIKNYDSYFAQNTLDTHDKTNYLMLHRETVAIYSEKRIFFPPVALQPNFGPWPPP
jgi:hypothetical protein